jgi:toxin CptA
LLLGALSAGLYIVGTNTPNKPLVWQLGLITLAWLCSALGVLLFLRQLAVGELDFDGAHWYFADKTGELGVRFDGQSCMLVRFEDGLQKADWLWLEARFAPNHWHDLRRAVYSRAESKY